MTATFETLLELDELLVAGGHHPLTPWWRAELDRFYGHPTANTYIGQVGRGGAKSNTSTKVGLNECLFGDWKVPPGERHYWAYVSRSKEEAAQRLMLLQSFLRSLGVEFDAAGDEIALRDAPRGFRVFACQIGAVSGFRCFGYSADEVSKWQAGTDHANPAAEVCSSLSAMTITHPGARRLLISSPFGMVDYHHECFARGENADQIVANAPSWVANPDGITEEATHKAESNPRVWAREYAAIPSSAAGAALEPQAIERGFAHVRTFASTHQKVLVVDPSSGRKDTWSWGVFSWVECATTYPPVLQSRRRFEQGAVEINGQWRQCDNIVDDFFVQRDGQWVPYVPEKAEPFLMVHEIDGVEGAFFDQVPADEIVARLAVLCRRNGIGVVHSDQREEYALASLFSKAGLRFIPHAYSSASKADGMAHLRRWFSEGKLALPRHEKLRSELLNFEEKITPSGAITFGARGSGHDDFVAILLTAAIADLDRGLPGSPTRLTNQRTIVSGN